MVFTGIVMAIAFVMMVIYRLVNILPPAGISKDTQAIAILNDASCAVCHQKDNKLPFYARFPGPENRFNKNAKRGILYFDITETIEKINKKEAINETALAKIEMATTTGAMPPATFSLFHWGSSVTPAKQKILKEWIDSHRKRFYPNHFASDIFNTEPVRPLPPPVSVNKKKASLGEQLFYDTRLSSDNSISCSSCHNLRTGGTDNRQYPEGINQILGNLNTPTVYNACCNNSHGWDGHITDLKILIAEHMLSPYEMANQSFDHIVNRLLKDKDMKKAFDKLYKEGITETSIIDALEEFEKTLVTPDCRFDRYLKGEESVLNQTEIQGNNLFKSNKCATCHAGSAFGGQSEEVMGLYEDYFKNRGWEITEYDLGRYKQTLNEHDRYRFKVPGLRNVALTKPYFHDGSQQTLYDAVKTMGRYQSGCSIKDGDIKAIVSFLETLTGNTYTEENEQVYKE